MKRSKYIIRNSTLILTMAVVLFVQPIEGKAADNDVTEPVGMWLTWQQDPTTTMTIDWHTEADDEALTTIKYRKKGQSEWEESNAESRAYPYSDRSIHRVELTELESESTYEFQVGEFTRTYKFRTMPSQLDKPVRFATGGDVRHRKEWMEKTNSVALQYDLDFIAWGGDLAYADGREDRLYRWYEFFNAYMNTLITEDGRAIPILVTLGNHETVSGYWLRDERFPDELDEYSQDDGTRSILAPYFFEFFAMPGQPGYNVLDFGDYMSFILLDSDHANPVVGEQTEWLETTLSERDGMPHIFPIYHVTAYPSHRDFDHHRGIPERIRENWVPLFEEYGVRIAFEKHDHTYKRTYPIRNNEIDPTGITYIGDGAWGVNTRSGNSSDEWYIKQFASERHAIITTVHGQHQHVLIINEEGEIIDEYPRTAHTFHYGILQNNLERFMNEN